MTKMPVSQTFPNIQKAPTRNDVCAALARLSGYMNAELEGLTRIVGLAGLHDLSGSIKALHTLHLEPTASLADEHELLSHAHATLHVALEALRSLHGSACHPTERVPEDWDAAVAYHGARVEDIVRTLGRVIRDDAVIEA